MSRAFVGSSNFFFFSVFVSPLFFSAFRVGCQSRCCSSKVLRLTPRLVLLTRRSEVCCWFLKCECRPALSQLCAPPQLCMVSSVPSVCRSFARLLHWDSIFWEYAGNILDHATVLYQGNLTIAPTVLRGCRSRIMDSTDRLLERRSTRCCCLDVRATSVATSATMLVSSHPGGS